MVQKLGPCGICGSAAEFIHGGSSSRHNVSSFAASWRIHYFANLSRMSLQLYRAAETDAASENADVHGRKDESKQEGLW